MSAGSLTVTPAALTITADNSDQGLWRGRCRRSPPATPASSMATRGQPSLSRRLTTATASSHVAAALHHPASGLAAEQRLHHQLRRQQPDHHPGARLTITADNQTKVYGAADAGPDLRGYAASQFSDTAASGADRRTLSPRPPASMSAVLRHQPGQLAADTDYTISFTGSSLTITPAR